MTLILLKLLELRNFIIFSLILQSTLIFLSPLRKKTASPAVATFLWVEYTVASLAADYAVGLITSTSVNPSNKPLISLWAPFVLLQVVGSDTITAFSLEDTNSWFRNTIRLFLTGFAVSRAMFVLFPKNLLAASAVLVCLAGSHKCYETTRCLFLGNLTRFKTFTKQIHEPDDDAVARQLDALPDGSVNDKLCDADVARDAFGFFHTFKGVFANVVFSPGQCGRSRAYFLRRDAEDAFALVETELNFAYDILFTKKLALTWRFGRNFRLATVALEFVAFFIWVSVDKTGFDQVDVRITYTLFSCALIFEMVFVLIHLFSTWTVASVLLQSTSKEESFWIKFLRKFVSFKNKFGLLSRRWSGSVSRYSLIMWCTSKSSPRVEKLLGWIKIKDFVYNWRNLSPTRFDSKLRDLIFNELRYRSLKSEQLHVAKLISSARGDWILRDYYHNNPLVLTFAETWFTKSMKLDKIVLLWHVATDLCYYACASDTDVDDGEEKELREYTKVISDYMAYILVREQTMLSDVAGDAKTTFQHTCDEVVKILIVGPGMEGLKGKEEKVEKACMMIMENPYEDVVVDDGRNCSVLQDARRLSKELKGMKDEGVKMWEVMSKLWVELLCYSACNCKASDHAAQLCKGGQLLTIVWLLSAHMGLSNRFEHSN